MVMAAERFGIKWFWRLKYKILSYFFAAKHFSPPHAKNVSLCSLRPAATQSPTGGTAAARWRCCPTTAPPPATPPSSSPAPRSAPSTSTPRG